jgi:hypothetical protein
MSRFLVVGLMALSSVAMATDSTVEWSFGVPQTMALGLGTGDSTGPGLQSCGAVAPQRNNSFQDRIVVTNTGTRRAELSVRTQPLGGNGSTACPSGMDTTMAVYSGAFNPAQPTANCLAYNDDIDGSTMCSGISAVSVAPGASVTVVVSGFNNGDHFPYDLRFDGSVYSPSVFYASFEPVELFNGHGMPATGQFTVDNYPAPFAAGSMLNGGVDARNGNLQGRLALSPVQLQDIATGLGFITLRAQMWQDGSGGGAVTAGNANYTANNLFLRLQHATINGAPVDLGGNCQFGPITWALAGNADASDIDLMQASFAIPPVSPTACNNFGAQLSSVVAGSDNSVTLSLAR